MEIGLKKPGEKDKNGIDIAEQGGHIKRGVEIAGKKDWSQAIFVSPSIFYSADPVYADTVGENSIDYACVVEVLVKPGSFEEFDSTVLKR